ncbi:MAG: ABC transporter permease [Candidatus Aminicenantes bacterium]|nr:ABC transporter permease [Candidatus Aminicenantes bacterium]
MTGEPGGRPFFAGIRPVIRKEFRQIRRDPRSLGFLLFLPAFLLLVFGYALNFDVKHVSLAVCDLDGTQASRDFSGKFAATEYFDLRYRLSDPREADALLGREAVGIVLIIPRGFGDDLAAGRETKIQALVDGASAMTATTAAGYIGAIVQSQTMRFSLDVLERRGLNRLELPLAVETRVWYNPELRSARFLVPGLMVFILMVIVVISTALTVVRERERGTMEQILVSPVRPVDLVLGKTVPYVLISLVSAHVVLLLGFLLFGVPIRGNYLLLLLTMTLFLTGGLGQGVLISTMAKSQQVAFMISILTTFLPTFILSGFVFPIRNMPLVIQPFTYLIPARYFLATLRAVMLKGTGLGAFWKEVLFLAAFAAVTIVVSTMRLKRTGLEERPRRFLGGRRRVAR